jgi:hypothetical protein
MAISLHYTCECGATTAHLDEAQAHANEDGHVVRVSGTLTSNVPVISATAIAKAAEGKARDAAILRAARDRGLLKAVR